MMASNAHDIESSHWASSSARPRPLGSSASIGSRLARLYSVDAGVSDGGTVALVIRLIIATSTSASVSKRPPMSRPSAAASVSGSCCGLGVPSAAARTLPLALGVLGASLLPLADLAAGRLFSGMAYTCRTSGAVSTSILRRVSAAAMRRTRASPPSVPLGSGSASGPTTGATLAAAPLAPAAAAPPVMPAAPLGAADGRRSPSLDGSPAKLSSGCCMNRSRAGGLRRIDWYSERERPLAVAA